jgi:3-deoxy-alpha-D-manno-octulosonate 8-oxidase
MNISKSRNVKSIDRCIYGKGTFDQLDEILSFKRNEGGWVVFFLDDYFKGKDLEKRLPLHAQDKLIYISTIDEPTTELIDEVVAESKKHAKELPSAMVGIGGGCVIDVCKAASLMITNPGKAHEYQGLDLIKNKGVYSVVIPTISGTGAEVSMTAVLTGPIKKLGIKCDYTVPDQVVLDPDLILSVPDDQRFYTGMDSYIHAVEAMDGRHINEFARAFSEKSLDLCREVFLDKSISRELADEKLMVASYLGGMSLTYSQVGVCHALSYGLSYVLHTHHCIANCIAFNHLEDYYPEGVKEFKEMMKVHNITLPVGITKGLSDAELQKMTDTSYALDHFWDHAIGENWREVITKEKIRALFERM